MKVYELMMALAEMDAGAEVVYSDLKTADEVESCRRIEESQELYELSGVIKEVESEGKHVFLYT